MINDRGTMLHMVKIHALISNYSMANEPNEMSSIKLKKSTISNVCVWDTLGDCRITLIVEIFSSLRGGAAPLEFFSKNVDFRL